jgi:hypothetical protein
MAQAEMPINITARLSINLTKKKLTSTPIKPVQVTKMEYENGCFTPAICKKYVVYMLTQLDLQILSIPRKWVRTTLLTHWLNGNTPQQYSTVSYAGSFLATSR